MSHLRGRAQGRVRERLFDSKGGGQGGASAPRVEGGAGRMCARVRGPECRRGLESAEGARVDFSALARQRAAAAARDMLSALWG